MDTRELRRSLRAFSSQLTYEALPGFVNQTALDINVGHFQTMPPTDPDGQRLALRMLLGQQLSTKVKLAKSGKRKGFYIPNGARKNNLILANLLVNYWRGKAGKKGLYGDAMRRYSGKFRSNRTKGTGFLKSAFMPIIRGLNGAPGVVFHVLYANIFKGIAQWPGSKSSGTFTPAGKGWGVQAVFGVNLNKKFGLHGQEGKIATMLRDNMQAAFDWKAGKLDSALQRRLEEAAEKAGIQHT